MKVKIELIYKNGPKTDTVEIKDGLKGVRFMSAIDSAVMKKFGDDKEWERWNLISVEEEKP